MQTHVCAERCVCMLHEDPLPLLYARATGEHACQDPECENAHGMPWSKPWWSGGLATYDACSCGCGCEPDGDWHWSQQPWCRCVANGCPCVTDSPGNARGPHPEG